ncbi:type VI secretion system accessory protein TagJ [Acidisoma cladoniae]|jgi:type VI secretion system protein ImpE|uniref:type VI secretion system accessory protein TagJ n=1 Tax=Acidisoma cladoniae TaxID=3040935 RepID=UPI002549FCAA|nr:type VI secretion system accessory protein TagJ [Acidisoma sp. PAMC 29798]
MTDQSMTTAASQSAMDLFRAGDLREAIAMAGSAVRDAPADSGKRLFLAELLLFAGEFERADKTLDAMEALDMSLSPGIAPFRQLLRAETMRRQTWREGRLPEFLGEPTPALTLYLKSLVAVLAGDDAAAAEAAQDAEAVRPRVAGQHNDVAFDDIRDTDDVCAGFVEVLTVSGRYFWVPFERIEEAMFHPPQRLRDLFWRQCAMSIQGGPEGDVYVPTTYVTSSPESDGLFAVGRKTDWSGEALIRGRGQRLLLVGDEGVAVQDLGTLVIG